MCTDSTGHVHKQKPDIPPGVDVERVRSYLITQGEKYDFRELWIRVSKARLELIEALNDVDDNKANKKPSPDDWNVKEILAHLLPASRRNLGVIADLSKTDPDGLNLIKLPTNEELCSTNIANLRKMLIDDFVSWGALTCRLDKNVSLDSESEHPVFGMLNARSWFIFQRIHDTDHSKQILSNFKLD